jgi:hypothetical protein
MISQLLLLDVAPDPVTPAVGIAGLILIALVVGMLAVAGIFGFVFLLKRVRSGNISGTNPTVSEGSAAQVPHFQANSPNHP